LNERRSDQQPSGDLQQKLHNSMSDDISSIIDIRADSEREQRKGVPEIILGETKEPGQIITMAKSLLSASGRAIISPFNQVL
jgi:NCAIR mutase (PurE)-related protein